MSEEAVVATAPVVVATSTPAAVQVPVDVIPPGHQDTGLQSPKATSSGTDEPVILDVSAEICGAVSAQKYISQSNAHSAVSELHTGVQHAVCEEAATVCEDAVSPEPGLPDQPITEGSQITCLDHGVEGYDSLLLDNKDKCRAGSTDHYTDFPNEATELSTNEFRAAIDGMVTIASTETTGHQKNGIGVNLKKVCVIFKFVMSLLDFVWSSSRTIIFNGIVGIICFQVTNDPKGGSRNVLLSEFWRYRQKIHFVFK